MSVFAVFATNLCSLNSKILRYPVTCVTVTFYRYAAHLEVCMGLRPVRSRSASRRITNSSKERESSSYSELVSDDEDDISFNLADKRKKRKGRNGSKKLKGCRAIMYHFLFTCACLIAGTPSKKVSTEPDEPIDVEGEAYDLLSLQDLLHDSSRGSSPAGSTGSSSGITGSKRRNDKSAKTKRRKERASPNGNGSGANN